MPKKTDTQQQETVETKPQTQETASANDLVNALVQAINLTKPVEKKNAVNRKPGSPWHPKDGSPKLKLVRRHYQHGMLIDPDLLTNEEIALFNKLKVGQYFGGWVKVIQRKDGGIDIDYPIRTPAQRMKLLGMLKGGGLEGLLTQCVEEADNKKGD